MDKRSAKRLAEMAEADKASPETVLEKIINDAYLIYRSTGRLGAAREEKALELSRKLMEKRRIETTKWLIEEGPYDSVYNDGLPRESSCGCALGVCCDDPCTCV